MIQEISKINFLIIFNSLNDNFIYLKKMDTRAEKENLKEITRKDAEEKKLSRWREKLQSIISSKRFPPTHQEIQTVNQRQPKSEGKEDTQIKEESKKERKGYLPVDQHYKRKHSWKSWKKYWYCRSPYHFKKDCTRMQCFYCRLMGHIKDNCFKMKLEYIFNWLWKMAAIAREIEKKIS